MPQILTRNPAPRVGDFTTANNAVTVDFAGIDAATVICNESPVAVTYTNGVRGKVYRVNFVNFVGTLVLQKVPKTMFHTTMMDYLPATLMGGSNWYLIVYAYGVDEYHVIYGATGFV